jgi:hypothetical protein
MYRALWALFSSSSTKARDALGGADDYQGP